MTTPHWSPTQVLQLDPHSTCIGHAETQGRRCRNPIAYANRKEAASILSEISRLDPKSARVECELEELASRLLCQRWHQDQALEMKRQWLCRIEDDCVAGAVRRRVERARIVEGETETAAGRSAVARSRGVSSGRGRVASLGTPVVIHASVSLTISITVGEVSGGRESNEPHEQLRDRTDLEPDSSSRQRQVARDRTNPEPDSPSQQVSPTHQSDTLSSPSSTNTTIPPSASPQENPTTTRAEEPEQVQETSDEAQPSQPIPEPSSQPQKQQQHEDSLPTHHSRRIIEGECSICYEDLHDGDNVEWCRAQCTQNFHVDCIQVWHASQEVDARVKTCPYW